jgi:threonine synthase
MTDPPGTLAPPLVAYPRIEQWLSIDAEGRVTIFSGKVEVGQGIQTALVQLVADELGVAPDRVSVAPVDTDQSPDEGITSGSRSVEESNRSVRRAAAEARRVLLLRAAERLAVPPDGVLQAASWTLKEEVTFRGASVASRGWDTYPILRFGELPDVHVALVSPPDQPPAGVGEAFAGPTAGAIGNALYHAGGGRVRDMPFTCERIAGAMAEASAGDSAVGMTSFLADLVCTACGTVASADKPHGTCPSCGKVLFARYDLDALRAAMPAPAFDGGAFGLWRYGELLPVRDVHHRRSLGEGGTPLLRLSTPVAAAAGLPQGELVVKDESGNPTGSFKARGLSVAIARAAELGIGEVAIPSAGNAGSAAAAFCAALGLTCHVAMPRDAPAANRAEVRLWGADLIEVDGLIDLAGRVIRERAETGGWFDLSTLREPYRVEGKKTMGIELAEAGGWGTGWCPDVVVYPTGGGTGIVGMWKACAELERLGWIGPSRPRMVVVQSTRCAPMVRAFENGLDHAEPWSDAKTFASGIRVPSAIGDYLILRAVRQSGGTAVAVPDEEIAAAQRTLARDAGIDAAPEGTATVAALPHLARSGFLRGDERVIIFNTGSGLRYRA